jgi:hypothetical protein
MNYRLDKMIKVLRDDAVVPPAHIKESLMVAVCADAFYVKRGFAWRYAVGFAVLVVLGTGGTVFASQQVMPGNFLYPVKRASENAYVSMQPTAQSQVDAQQLMIDRRFFEAETVDIDGDYGDMLSHDIADASDAWVAAQERYFSNDIQLVSSR